MDDMERDDVLCALNHARAVLEDYFDTEDTDHPQVQRPNKAMQVANAIDEALEIMRSI